MWPPALLRVVCFSINSTISPIHPDNFVDLLESQAKLESQLKIIVLINLKYLNKQLDERHIVGSSAQNQSKVWTH